MSSNSTVPNSGLENGADESTILVFGNYIGTADTKKSMDEVVRQLSQGPHRDWVLDTIAELSNYWDALVAKMPEVAVAIPETPQCLVDLDSWFRHGTSDLAPDALLPRPVLGPVVVLAQLTQYWQYLELTHQGEPVADVLASRVASSSLQRRPASLGFCAGLMPAVAVAGAHNRQDFHKYGAVAVRLAMLAGALTDAREAQDRASPSGSSVSFATAWLGQKQGDDLRRIVDELSPDTYVAVIYDESRASLVTNEQTGPLLRKRLRAAGIIAAETEMRARLHDPDPTRTGHVDALIELCDSTPGLQYADAAGLALATYDNGGSGTRVCRGNLTELVMRAMLSRECDWYSTFSAVATEAKKPFVVTFGPEQCVPPTWIQKLSERVKHFEEFGTLSGSSTPETEIGSLTSSLDATQQLSAQDTANNNSIAVVGMSIKAPGADNLAEFVDMLKTGRSQHELITRDRMEHDLLFRRPGDPDPKRKYYGNFVRDPDAFDHRFFKRSPRESAAMDPQGRMVLEGAYQAVEQSGYFHGLSDNKHVGVYLGTAGCEYDYNIECNDTSAFTGTGSARSFIAGRVSHYFGWTGPTMTFDTACSSSAVAIHTACRNLISGECTAALAGGCNAIANIMWFQNLAAGNFLSPTGQCKPFDDDADGYCRADGFGFVFLKKLSDAVRDGNPVLAVISSTAVYQNQNTTPIFVPNSPSLSQLFGDVVRKANIAPRDISLIEAHGTGTAVGDPAEYESIRVALGGPASGRVKKLPIGSVKGHIGHAEGASGVLALIKIIVMMRDAFIPPQASFSRMNHNIKVRPDDMMEVVTKLRPWEEEHKIALLNNYGACGSNASFIVAQPPKPLSGTSHNMSIGEDCQHPFWIPGLDARAISDFCAKLASYCRSLPSTRTLADISFAVNRQSNRGLAQGLVFSCRSRAELEEKLRLVELASNGKDLNTQVGIISVSVKPERPVILCFGGQVSRFVGLDRKLYDNVAIFRKHLDDCDAVATSLGLGSLYPDIFSQQPIPDTVKLQTVLFAMQYACAQAWIHCGLENKVAAVVGHSFGEITALCAAGTLSLEHAVKLVAARARLVRDEWGTDPGAMMTVESDEALVKDLVQEVNGTPDSDGLVSIACYNGPRSFTLAGSTAGIDALQRALTADRFSTIKSKRLSVTNAFHSALVEKIVNGLGSIGKEVTFHKPVIPVERATEEAANGTLDWSFVPNHMRQPVFFNHALQRLARRHPQAVFLEAGSNSTITVMAARALAQANLVTPEHHFQAVSITNTQTGFDGLTDATVALWKQGLRVSFWPHHRQQTLQYAPLLLPPYQFDKSPASRHWLPVKSARVVVEKAAEALLEERGTALGAEQGQGLGAKPLAMWDFVGYQDKHKKKARFRINTGSETFRSLFTAHSIAKTAPICPGVLAWDIAIEALFSLEPDARRDGLMPIIRESVYPSPLCADLSRAVYLDLSALGTKSSETKQWEARMFSVGNDAAAERPQTHFQARVDMGSPTATAYVNDFALFERFASHSRCLELLKPSLDEDSTQVLQGRHIYRAFSPVVDYGDIFQGVCCLVGRGEESAARVQLDRRHRRSDTWLDTPLSDSFAQVSGIWVNLMTNVAPEDMYVAAGCDKVMRSPRHTVADRTGTDVWHVYARHSRQSDTAYLTDLYVFDAATGLLVEVMLGLQYHRVSKASMSKMLARLTKDESVLRGGITASHTAPSAIRVASGAGTMEDRPNPQRSKKRESPAKTRKNKKASSVPTPNKRDITDEVRQLVASVSGVDADEMGLDANMADLGIDSLLGMEMGREVEKVFKCTLDPTEQLAATTLRMFVVCVEHALFGADAGLPLARADEAHGASSSDADSSSDANSDYDSSARDSSLVVVDQDLYLSTPDMVSDSESSENLQATAKAEGPTKQDTPPAVSNLSLSSADILDSFGEVRMAADTRIREFHVDNTEKAHMAGSNRLCAALVVEALDELGSPIRTAAAGQALDRIAFPPRHSHLVQSLYGFLERDARLIDIDTTTGQITRTHFAVPTKASNAILQELLLQHPQYSQANRLAHHAGKQLASVLAGKTDGIRVLFGSPEAQELTAAIYSDWPPSRMNNANLRDVVKAVCERLRTRGEGETLKILEMGAGTGGTTKLILPVLASLDIPVEYTFTDLSSSMVAGARRHWQDEHPFMRFAVHDIEEAPAEYLQGAHIVLAGNAVHATHNLFTSLTNIRRALRSDGFLMLAELTSAVPFLDLVFGLLEGWWLFDDGREHAIVPAEHWEREMHAAGFGHVDWIDGNLAENRYQKVIVAMASCEQGPRLPKAILEPGTELDRRDVAARTAEAERLVAKYSSGWDTPRLRSLNDVRPSVSKLGAVVLVTGATGSLGSHIVQKLAENPTVAQVVCVNRHSSEPVHKRQQEAFVTRGIVLGPGARAKLRVMETDTSKEQLGLPPTEYAWLVQHATHVVHNAWPMSVTRPVAGFEPQLQAMRNLLDLARDAAVARQNVRVAFQFVSSIGVVGCAGEARVLERRVPLGAALPRGYPEAKWVCERMLDETLHRYPNLFRPHVVRAGQIAGSSTSGYWNPVEHFAFVVKSSQAVRAWPDLDGVLQWVPVDHCGAVAADLVLNPAAEHPVYHIDNPVGQPWRNMSPVLARALGIPEAGIVPFESWIRRVRTSPLSDAENPAARPGMVDFLASNFERIAGGALILDVERAKEHSVTMAGEGPVSPELAIKYVDAWRKMGFLH